MLQTERFDLEMISKLGSRIRESLTKSIRLARLVMLSPGSPQSCASAQRKPCQLLLKVLPCSNNMARQPTHQQLVVTITHFKVLCDGVLQLK